MSNILEEADRITSKDRNADYGHPLDNFRDTAALWRVYLTAKYNECPPLDFEDVAMLNVLQKIARQCFKRKRDNLVDAAGYLRTIEMCDEKLAEDFKRATAGPEDIDKPMQKVAQCPIHNAEPGRVIIIPSGIDIRDTRKVYDELQKQCTCRS